MKDITKCSVQELVDRLNIELQKQDKQRMTCQTLKSVLKKVGITDRFMIDNHEAKLNVYKRTYGNHSYWDRYVLMFEFDNTYYMLKNEMILDDGYDSHTKCIQLYANGNAYDNKRTIYDMLKHHLRTLNREYELTITDKGTKKVLEYKRLYSSKKNCLDTIAYTKSCIQSQLDSILKNQEWANNYQKEMDKLLGR